MRWPRRAVVQFMPKKFKCAGDKYADRIAQLSAAQHRTPA